MMLVWGLIVKQMAWHVYTHKAAKHDGGILTARPVCGAPSYARSPLANADFILRGEEPDTVPAGVTVCETCRAKWTKQEKGRR